MIARPDPNFGFHDVLNRLIQETTGQGMVNYQYDVLGRRTQLTANGQPPTTYQYDAASRLTRVEQGALFAALSYDNANRRVSLSYSNGATTSYSYDGASRVTGITHNGSSGVIDALTYSYDAAGNRISLTRNNGTASLLPNAVTSAIYDAGNEQTQFAGATLTYDNNGNLTSDGVNAYQWDARNRLLTVSGGMTGSFSYDVIGRRSNAIMDGVSKSFQYDRDNVTAEIRAGGVTATYLRTLHIDRPLSRKGEVEEFYHADAVGSPLILTDNGGAARTQYTYEPFGKTVSSGAVSTNILQYTGREHDGNDLYYYRFRYYSNRLQRFLSEDPAGFQGGDVNLYAYASNAPTMFSDPLGLWLPNDHWNQTVEAAQACGLSRINSYQLAWGNIKEDIFDPWSWFSNDDPIHAMPGTNYGPIVNTAMNNAVATQNWPAALSYLGSGLHTVQDKWAHDLRNPPGNIEEHRNPTGGFSPDDPNGSPFDWWASRKDTENFIADFMRARGMKPRC